MFHHKKTQEQLAPWAPTSVPTMQELITAYRIPSKDLDETPASHLQRLSALLGDETYIQQYGFKSRMSQVGFMCFVKPALILSFHAHAIVGWCRFKHDCVAGFRQSRIVYQGEIPDFALDRLETAIATGAENFTIHSMQPFPVGAIKLMPLDPILVGWSTNPHLYISANGDMTIDDTSAQAVILAIWDKEKELEVI